MGVFRKGRTSVITWTFSGILVGFVLPDSGADVIGYWTEL